MQPYVNANKKSVLLRFAPVGSSRLYSKMGHSALPPFRMRQAYHPAAASVNPTSCDRACDRMRRGYFFARAGYFASNCAAAIA